MTDRQSHARPGPRRLQAGPECAGSRLDACLAEALGPEGHARAEIQRWIKDGLVRLGGAVATKPGLRLRGNETIEVELPEQACGLAPEQGELAVLYADDDLLVVNKPPGLSVHPASERESGTLVHRLAGRYPAIADMDGLRPGVVHRLDKDTSGVLLVALTNAARLKISADFAARRMDKDYLAVVHGRPKGPHGRIEAPIGRDPSHPTRMAVVRKGGREAASAYDLLWTDPTGRFSLLHVRIFTGRTHQIRVHLAHIGHPVAGDAVYGPQARAILRREDPALAKLARRQLLHAWRIALDHPTTDERLTFTAPAPRDMAGFVRLASRRLQRVILVGPMGCGKSEVLRRVNQAGFPILSADAVVADLYAPGADGWTLLRRRFGNRFTPSDKAPVDKRAMLQAMLETPSLRREVEDLVHPLVRHVLDRFWADNARARAAFAEVPLYFEAGWQGAEPDTFTIYVDCPEPARQERTMARGLAPQAAQAMAGWQIDPQRKRAMCDFVIDNAGSLDNLADQVSALLAALRRKRAQAARAFAFPLPTDAASV